MRIQASAIWTLENLSAGIRTNSSTNTSSIPPDLLHWDGRICMKKFCCGWKVSGKLVTNHGHSSEQSRLHLNQWSHTSTCFAYRTDDCSFDNYNIVNGVGNAQRTRGNRAQNSSAPGTTCMKFASLPHLACDKDRKGVGSPAAVGFARGTY